MTSGVVIGCEPAFNGGSEQRFLLQTLSYNGFDTVEDDSDPRFRLQTAENTTVRVCAVNADFPNVKRCSSPLEIMANIEGTYSPNFLRSLFSSIY